MTSPRGPRPAVSQVFISQDAWNPHACYDGAQGMRAAVHRRPHAGVVILSQSGDSRSRRSFGRAAMNFE